MLDFYLVGVFLSLSIHIFTVCNAAREYVHRWHSWIPLIIILALLSWFAVILTIYLAFRRMSHEFRS